MNKPNVVLIGYGEVGKAIREVFYKYCNKIYITDNKLGRKDLCFIPCEDKCDFLFIAIPYSKDFIKSVKTYQKSFNPKCTVVFSTVPIGTCSQISAIHSPIEGKHPYLAESIIKSTRWVGGYDKELISFFKKCLKEVRVVEKPEYTEFLKLFSTSIYAVNIQFMKYGSQVAEKIGMPYDFINDFNQDYNKLYQRLKMPEFQRYILRHKPKVKIGGHCIIPNTKILNKQFPNIFLQEIIK